MKIKKEQNIDFLLVKLKFENNKKINASDILAEWDPLLYPLWPKQMDI